MNGINLEALGFTQEELQQRIIDRICDTVLTSMKYDYDDDHEYSGPSMFYTKLNKQVEEKITTTIKALAEKHVLPNVSDYIENLTLQQTNQWGEKRGGQVSFIEYLVQRAEYYMQEKVSFDGKTKEESSGYSWNGTQTRVSYMINKHLHRSIETAMQQALSVANSAIAAGLEATVKMKLEEITKSLKVAVKP
jgi:hypothetical protein